MQDKGYKGKGMDGFIARWYDKNARKNLMWQYKEWSDRLLKLIPKTNKILEVAPGPGYLAIELAKSGVSDISGLEISETFIGIAEENSSAEGVNVKFIQGSASDMPFEDGMFDNIICTSAFKNFSEPVKALDEMCRTLKPGGFAWISDLRKDLSDASINHYIKNDLKMHGISGLFMKLTFENMLRKRAYTKESFEEFIKPTKFKEFKINEAPIGFEIYLYK